MLSPSYSPSVPSDGGCVGLLLVAGHLAVAFDAIALAGEEPSLSTQYFLHRDASTAAAWAAVAVGAGLAVDDTAVKGSGAT